jgi:hypothetical protein
MGPEGPPGVTDHLLMVSNAGVNTHVQIDSALAELIANAPAFAPEHYYASNTLVSNLIVNSAVFVTVLTLAPTVAGGTYELSWNYSSIGNASYLDHIVVVRHAGGTQGNPADPDLLYYARREVADAEGSTRVGGTGTDQEKGGDGFVEVVLPPGLATFTIEHRSSSNSARVSLWDPRLKLVRVS